MSEACQSCRRRVTTSVLVTVSLVSGGVLLLGDRFEATPSYALTEATRTFPITDEATGEVLSTDEIVRRTEMVLRGRFARIATVDGLVKELAEKAGVVIGIETALDAAGEVTLLEEVGSDAVKSYFNFSNALKNGRDLVSELKTLGAERICQIHATDDDGVWLQNNPRIDLKAVKAALDEIGWRGWLVVERSRDAKRSGAADVKWNYSANVGYLKSLFQVE